MGRRKKYDNRKNEKQDKGLSVLAAIFFVVGDIVGAGIVTLPYIMRMVSWWGVPLFFLSGLIMCLCGILLSKGCLVVFTGADREKLRDPYPLLAEYAYGKAARYGVTVILNLSLMFTCIIFLLLLGEVFTQIAPIPTEYLSTRNQLRLWFLICAATLLPLTYLRTPKDFSLIGPTATTCSIISGLFILINLAMITHTKGAAMPTRLAVDPETLLAAFGTIQFTFGGIAIFPTIQNDLKEPEKFPYAVAVGYAIVASVYTLISVLAFLVLDQKIQEDILTSFSTMSLYKECIYFKSYVIIAQVLICGHVLAAFIMLINPINQQLEAIFQTPIQFTWHRIVIRTSMVIVICVIATAVPNFGPVLSLAGGTFFTLLNIIFPILFYCKLSQVTFTKEILLGIIIVLSVVTAIGNGYVEVKNVVKVIKGEYSVIT